jgi:hypothetical protein
MRFLVFFLVATLLLVLIYGYVGWRLISGTQINASFKLTLWLIIASFLLLLLLQFFMRLRNGNIIFQDFMAWMGYLGLGFFLIAFSLLVIRDVFYLLAMGSSKAVFYAQGSWLALPDKIPGAHFIKEIFSMQTLNKSILTISFLATLYGLYESHRLPRVKEIVVPLRNLPLALEDLRIVQITDLHIGPTLKKNFLDKVVQRVNSLNPDIIALTGDLVDGSFAKLRNEVAPIGNLKSRYGNFFVTGNHEYYSGVWDWLEEVKKLGFLALNNENVILKIKNAELVLAGVTDFTAGTMYPAHRTSPAKALQGTKGNLIKILLAHQPKSITESVKEDVDLQISGHTHGGQFLPWNFFVSLDQPYTYGLHRRDHTWIYVSRGTGYWGPPLRLGAPSEITLIKLKREESKSK